MQVKVPPPLPQWMTLARPFQTEVWIAFVVSVLATITFFLSYAKFYPQNDFKLGDVWFYIVSIVLEQEKNRKGHQQKG